MIDSERQVLGAMMISRGAQEDARRLLDPSDFVDTDHADLFDAIIHFSEQGNPVDANTLPQLVPYERLARWGGSAVLQNLVHDCASTANVGYHATRIRDAAARRKLLATANMMQSDLNDMTVELQSVLEAAQEQIDRVYAPSVEKARIFNVAEIMEATEDYDWAVPDVLERGDRLIIVGPEGFGKSEFLRQILLMASQGIHPFHHRTMTPRRVLLVDLENSAAQVGRRLRAAHIQAKLEVGDESYDPSRFRLVCRPEGIDLHDRHDRWWLSDVVSEVSPEILSVGPLYKLVVGDSSDDQAAIQVTKTLDRLRSQHNCAVMIEHHSPKPQQGRRDYNPFGSSVWMRWPEFGLALEPDEEDPQYVARVRHFRGARDERDFPQRLRKGGKWPFTPME